jgi:hypothetical protein
VCIALLVVALTWKGGHLTAEYSVANRYSAIPLPTLAALQQNWSAPLTQASWGKALAPPAEPRATVAVLAVVEAPPALVPAGPELRGWATHYGESFTGGVLGCGTGLYDPRNPVILAVGPSRYREWPCGTLLRVCGPAGCAVVERHDSCPGCGPSVVDLSEAGNALVCGEPPHTCRVTMQPVRIAEAGLED